MAGLLRIQPQIPSGSPGVNVQQNAWQAIGKGLSEFGEHLEKQEDAADTLAATRALGEASAGIDGAVRIAATKTNNPDEFHALATEGVSSIHQATRDGLMSNRARARYDALIADNLGKAKTAIALGAHEKVVQGGIADFSSSSNRRVDEATIATPEKLKQIFADEDKGLAELAKINGLTPPQIVAHKRAFETTIKAARGDYFKEVMQGKLNTLANDVRRDPLLADSNYQAGLAEIERASVNAEITPQKISEAKQSLRNSIYVAQGEAMIEKNPMEADARLKEGFFNQTLDPTHIRYLEAKTGAAITQLREGLKAQVAERDRVIKKQLSEFESAGENGFTWGGDITGLKSAVQGTEHEQKFNDIIKQSDRVMVFGKSGLVAQERMLRDMASRPMVGDDPKIYAKLESIHKEAREAVDKDGLTYAIRRRIVPNVLPFDVNNPNSLAERSQAANMASAYLDYPISPLSDDEVKTEIARFANSKPDQNVAMMAKLNAGFTPGQISVIAKQFAAKGAGELAQAIGMSSQVPDASSRILKGQEIKRTNPDALPRGEGAATQMSEFIAKSLGGAYRASPKSRDGAIDAIKSVYAWASWEAGDMSGTYKEERLRNAVATVTGGIISFNGDPVLPPRYGIDETQMRQMIAKADLSNTVEKITARGILDGGRLYNVGPGRYNVVLNGKTVADKTGKDFELNLNGITPGLPGPSAATTALGSGPGGAAWVK